MSVKTKMRRIAATLLTPKSQMLLPARQPHRQELIPLGAAAFPVPRRPKIIEMRPEYVEQIAACQLSAYLRVGSKYHALCRYTLVEQVYTGYYAYERRSEFRTDALAAAYAGAFGPDSVKCPDFSYSMAVWRLSRLLGYDLTQQMVTGPTGRVNNVADEMIQLVDEDNWSREGVAEWLESIGL